MMNPIQSVAAKGLSRVARHAAQDMVREGGGGAAAPAMLCAGRRMETPRSGGQPAWTGSRAASSWAMARADAPNRQISAIFSSDIW